MYKTTTKTGTYTPKNIEKYIGKQLPVFRSSWLLKAFVSLDVNPKIIQWGSLSIIIPYIDTGRSNTPHRYIVDLFFEIKDMNGKLQKWLLEIKPYNQSVQPKVSRRKSPKTILILQQIYQTNKCKWGAAMEFCKDKGWHFGVWTLKGITQLC